MKNSRALIIKDKGLLEFQELEIPTIGDYEVLFKTASCSLCTVDRRTYLGTRNYQLPFLGGHECSGIVEKVGKGVVELEEGDHVILTAAYCNQCTMCRTGKGTQCANKKKMPKRIGFEGAVLGGGLSEYLAVPAWQLIKVPKHVKFDHAAMTEPLACCVHSIEKADIQFGDKVLIIGFGIMGYFHMKLAQMKGGIPIVYELDEAKLALARKHGAICINPSNPNWKEQFYSICKTGADVIVNTIAVSSIWKEAIAMLAPYGKLLAYSSQDTKKGIEVDFGDMHGKEYEFIGTINPTIEDNEKAVAIISANLIDMTEVIDSVYQFEDGIAAFERASEPNIFRVVISYQNGQEEANHAC